MVNRRRTRQDAATLNLLAYLDPGSGSMILQALAGGVAAIAVVGKMYWRRITRLFGRGPDADN